MAYVDDDDGIKLSTRHGLKDVEARNLKQFIITTIWVFLCSCITFRNSWEQMNRINFGFFD